MAENRAIQIVIVLIVGIAVGVVGPRAYDKWKVRKWYSSYDILQLAAPVSMQQAAAADAESHQLALKIMDLQEERKKYRAPFGSGEIAPVSEATERFQTAIRDASIQSSVFQEQSNAARIKASEISVRN